MAIPSRWPRAYGACVRVRARVCVVCTAAGWRDRAISACLPTVQESGGGDDGHARPVRLRAWSVFAPHHNSLPLARLTRCACCLCCVAAAKGNLDMSQMSVSLLADLLAAHSGGQHRRHTSLGARCQEMRWV
jgi:hypothetical protein